MADHFIGVACIYLMRSTSQEVMLKVKIALEQWEDTSIFRIKRYHVDNGTLYKKPFRGAFEEANQTNNFCGI